LLFIEIMMLCGCCVLFEFFFPKQIAKVMECTCEEQFCNVPVFDEFNVSKLSSIYDMGSYCIVVFIVYDQFMVHLDC
jgi:hypothetical protein